MTLTQTIIIDGYRESDLIALGDVPDGAQYEEGLRLLQRIVLSVFAHEVGETLCDFIIGGEYPYSGWTDEFEFLPSDVRIIPTQPQLLTLKLPPYPQNGDRIQLVDSGTNFATWPVTLVPQAASFNGSHANYVADEQGFNAIWIYNAATVNWERLLPLDITAEFPFPEAHDDAFIGMLATRLSPRYERSLSAESRASLTRAIANLRTSYSRTKPTPADLAVLRLSSQRAWTYGYGGGPYTLNRFKNGIPW